MNAVTVTQLEARTKIVAHKSVIIATDGTEYFAGKKNPKTVDVTRMSDNAPFRLRYEGVKEVRDATYTELVNFIEKDKGDERIRVGAVATVVGNAARLIQKHGFSADTKFVVIKENDGKCNIIELGGNSGGRYYRSVPKTDLQYTEVA